MTHSLLQAVFVTVGVLFITAATVGAVSNLTTGITIAHTGFTVNKNVTASIGLVPLLQLYPVLYVLGSVFLVYVYGLRKGWFE